MAKHAFARLQIKPLTNEEVISRGKKIKLTSDQKFYIDEHGNKLRRATSVIGSVQDEFNSKKVAKEVSDRDTAKNILERDLDKYKVSPREFKTMGKMAIMDLPGMSSAVEAWNESNVSKQAKSVQNLIDLWDFKREAGTEIHEVLEWYVQERQKLEKDEYGNLDTDYAKGIALDKLIESGTEGKVEDFDNLINQIEKWIKTLPSGMRFETEVKIYDDVLKVAGTIDLMAFDDNDNVYIFDYKTKEINKEHLFAMKGDLKLKEPLDYLFDNKETLGALQTSLYRLILERQGKKVMASEILYIEAEVSLATRW